MGDGLRRKNCDPVESEPWVWLSAMKEVMSNSHEQGYVHSLSYVARRFSDALEDLGISHDLVEDPAIYTLPVASDLGRAARWTAKTCKASPLEGRFDGTSHFCIREWHRMRLMPGVSQNVCHFSWEGSDFPKAEPVVFGSGPIPTLKAFDKVLTCSRGLEDSLKSVGIESTKFVPTPIVTEQEAIAHQAPDRVEKLFREIVRDGSVFCPYFHLDPTFPKTDWAFKHRRLDPGPLGRLVRLLASKAQHSGDDLKIFLSQGNPGDKRKNLVSTMEGFALWAADQEDAFLIVLAPPLDIHTLSLTMGPAQAERFGWGWWGSRNIFVLPMHLSQASLLALYGLGDFFLNASRSEGQHIPLQEAIQAGCFPVSSYHTAMLEYLDPVASMVIPSEPRWVLLTDPASGVSYSQEWWEADPVAIADACDKASALSKEDRGNRVSLLRNSLVQYTRPTVERSLKSVFLEASL